MGRARDPGLTNQISPDRHRDSGLSEYDHRKTGSFGIG